MSSEFKVRKNNLTTIYTLESATAGATSSGAIASVPGGMGGVRKRGGNLLAQEANKEETPKPRNFVAKNAKMGGAGQHKDKKKAEKQGQVKHKKPFAEEWSQKYKSSINCSHPKGFSQKAHCAGKKKHNEDTSMEMVCPECGMCEAHGNLSEIKKGQKDSNGYTKCWPGHHAAGTKKGKNGGQVRNCVPNEGRHDDEGGYYANDDERDQQRQMDYNRSTRYGTGGAAGDEMDKESWYIVRDGKLYVVHIWPSQRPQAIAQGYSQDKETAMKVGGLAEDHADVGKGRGQGAYATASKDTSRWSGAGHDDSVHENPEWYNDEANDMTSSQLKSLVKHAAKLRKAVHALGSDTLEPWQQAKITKAADYLDTVFNAVDDDHDMGEEQDPYMESLSAKLAEKIPKNAPVDVYIKDFEKSKAPQFRGKSKEKRRQMAVAASYGAKKK